MTCIREFKWCPYFLVKQKNKQKIQNCLEFRFVLRLNSCPIHKKEVEYVILYCYFPVLTKWSEFPYGTVNVLNKMMKVFCCISCWLTWILETFHKCLKCWFVSVAIECVWCDYVILKSRQEIMLKFVLNRVIICSFELVFLLKCFLYAINVSNEQSLFRLIITWWL